MDMQKPILELKNIKKEYYGNKVLKGVSLDIYPGEIHCLVGENGAGKSTLMNILFGMSVIHETGGFEGEFIIEGKPAVIKTPNDALENGIGMVHQEFMLIPGFTIAENIKLNREPLKNNALSRVFGKSMKSLDTEKMKSDAKESLMKLGMDIDEQTIVKGLPVGYMQFVEIAREIDKKGVKVLVFDEPTAVLTESEADKLLEAMKHLAAEGIGILFITHRLDEVMAVSKRITVIRDGNHIQTMNTCDTDVVKIAELMVGRKVEKIERKVNASSDEDIMEIKNLKVSMPGELVKGVSFSIKKGEILGIGGLAGQGKIGIANGIMGVYKARGEVTFEGKPIKLNDPQASMSAGLSFVSEDRRGVGLLLGMSIEENMVVPSIYNFKKYLKKFLIFTQKDTKAIRENALKYIDMLDIRCTGPTQPVMRLSGGNQQKVCIARALTLEPKIIFVSEPTRGIDIGAKKIVLETLIKLNEEYGMTVVITSSELAELRSVCDRIAIISEGKLSGILSAEASDSEFGLLMSGINKKGDE